MSKPERQSKRERDMIERFSGLPRPPTLAEIEKMRREGKILPWPKPIPDRFPKGKKMYDIAFAVTVMASIVAAVSATYAAILVGRLRK